MKNPTPEQQEIFNQFYWQYIDDGHSEEDAYRMAKLSFMLSSLSGEQLATVEQEMVSSTGDNTYRNF